MKTQILALTTNPWKFKNNEGKELNGISLVFMLDDYSVHFTTVKDDLLKAVQSVKLPALFEVEATPKLKRNNETGKSTLKYEISNLKFVKESPIF